MKGLGAEIKWAGHRLSRTQLTEFQISVDVVLELVMPHSF